MASLYADEDIAEAVVDLLRIFGHDVMTAKEAGQAGQRVPDLQLLTFACGLQRAVLTHNQWDFVRLHNQNIFEHFGIITCTRDESRNALARRIHDAIVSNEPLTGKLIRVN